MNDNNLNNQNVEVNNNAQKYKLTLTRVENFFGSLIAFQIFIDNEKVAKIKNGETVVLEVTPGQHIIAINNKCPTTIIINGDTNAEVVIYGSNDFGITNVSGLGKLADETANTKNHGEQTKKQTNLLLYMSIILPVISIIMLFSIQKLIAAWWYGFIIGYAIVNVWSLKNFKDIDPELYKSLKTKNIVSIVICTIVIILTIIGSL